MVQEVLTYLAVSWAFYQVVLFFWRIFRPGPSKSACGGGGCTSCDAKTELYKHIKNGKYPTLIEDKLKV